MRSCNNYVCYRLPEQSDYFRLEQHKGEPVALKSAKRLQGLRGFVFAPFQPSEETPVWLLQADRIEKSPVDQKDEARADDARREQKAQLRGETCRTLRKDYHLLFNNCKAHMKTGHVQKVVLARHVHELHDKAQDPEELFLRACRMYPHQYIALVCLQKAGTWLMATPEVLIEGSGGICHTMALAGTEKMPDTYQDGQPIAWSGKNKKEQRYVATYICDTLRPFAKALTHSQSHTTMAAQLLHLRTDFYFTLKEHVSLSEVIDALHPTPAVCGMPKEAARNIISTLEKRQRRYYSGFCGPYDPISETRLYVILRCMEICGNEYILHAGGGIVPESQEDAEWKETEMKLNTMRNVL